ncbi:MAG TPA: ABC transporter permease [Longimicrobiales bacterium]|nr:ABC transporter permease [Longimicrobiales bacterium]
MHWRDIWILYQRELRSALRERAIVVNSILMPIFLYPLILWLMFSAITFVGGLSSRAHSRVALFDLPARHAEIADSLAALREVELVEVRSPETAARMIREEALDAAVEFLPASGAGGALEGNVEVRIHYDRSESRSGRARRRVDEVVDAYRARWLEREALARGARPEELTQFRIARENVSSEGEMGALLLGSMLPLFLVIMVALGCFYPAIDSTAGERERSTWETLMTVSASRGSVVMAKYLYVATLGIAAGVLNVIAMTASMGIVVAPMLADANESFAFRIPLMAVPVMMLGAVGLALFFAAAMMILASFARSFKDGQSMVTPIYWLALMPLLLGDSPDQRLTPKLALIPIANVSQMIKDAINGQFDWPLIGLTMAVLLALVVACLWLARVVLRFEDHVLGAYDGSFWSFARERLLPGRRSARAGGAS